VRDVTNDGGKHRSERTALNRTMKRGVARPRADVQDLVADGEHIQLRDGVDVDQMRRAREPESHDRHQALAARQDAASCGANSANSRTASARVAGRDT